MFTSLLFRKMSDCKFAHSRWILEKSLDILTSKVEPKWEELKVDRNKNADGDRIKNDKMVNAASQTEKVGPKQDGQVECLRCQKFVETIDLVDVDDDNDTELVEDEDEDEDDIEVVEDVAKNRQRPRQTDGERDDT
jgi:hypothetical protein